MNLLNIVVKNREDQNRWDLLGQVGKELQKEIKSRKFKNEDSLEQSFDSLCVDVAMKMGAEFNISDTQEYIFDFCNNWNT
jgi:hypothetical protein